MTAGKQILIYLVIGVIIGFIIGYISREFGSSWGIVIVVLLGLSAIIGYLKMTERSNMKGNSYVPDEDHGKSSEQLKGDLKLLNIKEDVTLSGEDAREWLDEFMVKQQTDSKS